MATDIEVQKVVDLTSDPGAEVPANAEEKVSARDAMMADLYAKRAEQVAQETGLSLQEPAYENEGGDPEQPAEPEPKPKPESPNPADAPTDTPASDDPAKEPESHKLVVNGKSIEVKEDLLKLAQRGLAADEKFRQAAKMREDAQAMLYALQQAQPQSAQPQHSAPEQPQPIITDDAAKAIVRGLNYGSEEEQVKAVSDLLSQAAQAKGQVQPNFTPEQIVQAATQNAIVQLDFRTNLERVAGEYQDIFADNMLSKFAGMQASELRQQYAAEGRQVPEIAIYREACAAVREKFVTPKTPGEIKEPPSDAKPSVQSASVSSMKEKLERKRAAPQPPLAVNRVASEQPKSQFPTGSDIVARMRQARGQAAF